MFRLLLGLAHPTEGRIEVCGIDVAADPIGVRARLGYMPEHDCLPLDQTAADVVSTFGELSGLPAARGAPAGVRHPRPRRARRGPLPPDRRVLDRHAPAHEARAGDRRRSRARPARRADRGARPARPRRDARARRPARLVRHLGADGDAPARRRAEGVRLRRDDRRRAARRRRARPTRCSSAPAPSPSTSARAGRARRRRSERVALPRSCGDGVVEVADRRATTTARRRARRDRRARAPAATACRRASRRSTKCSSAGPATDGAPVSIVEAGARAPSTTAATGRTRGRAAARARRRSPCTRRRCAGRSGSGGRGARRSRRSCCSAIVTIPAIVNVGIGYVTRDQRPSTGSRSSPTASTSASRRRCCCSSRWSRPTSMCPDRRQHVLPLMFARPLTGVDYVVAKVGAIATILFAFSFLPQVVLFVGNMLVSDSALDYFTGPPRRALEGAARGRSCSPCTTPSIGVAIASLTDRRIVAGRVRHRALPRHVDRVGDPRRRRPRSTAGRRPRCINVLRAAAVPPRPRVPRPRRPDDRRSAAWPTAGCSPLVVYVAVVARRRRRAAAPLPLGGAMTTFDPPIRRRRRRRRPGVRRRRDRRGRRRVGVVPAEGRAVRAQLLVRPRRHRPARTERRRQDHADAGASPAWSASTRARVRDRGQRPAPRSRAFTPARARAGGRSGAGRAHRAPVRPLRRRPPPRRRPRRARRRAGRRSGCSTSPTAASTGSARACASARRSRPRSCAIPHVLVLDEPLNGADPVQRLHLIALFQRLGAEGRTVIVSSHVLNEVERLARARDRAHPRPARGRRRPPRDPRRDGRPAAPRARALRRRAPAGRRARSRSTRSAA